MNLTSHVSHPAARPTPATVALLGPDHPLTRVERRLDRTTRQLLVTAGMLVGTAGALLTGSPAALPLAMASAVALLGLACRIALLRDSRRACALDLIRQGRGDLPIPVIARTSAQLATSQHRERLIQAVGGLLDPHQRSFDVVTLPWRFLPGGVTRSVRAELAAIATLLAEPGANIQGVALLERLLFDGMSSLHGDDTRLLGDDLRRIRFLLERPRAGP